MSAASCSPTAGIIMPAVAPRSTSSWTGMRCRSGMNSTLSSTNGQTHASGISGLGGLLQKAVVHTGGVLAFHVRSIKTLFGDDRVDAPAQGEIWIEDHRAQQRGARNSMTIGFISSSSTGLWIRLYLPVWSGSINPMRRFSGWPWTSP